jgi:L-aminopeptidase/D-esterase-like protein
MRRDSALLIGVLTLAAAAGVQAQALPQTPGAKNAITDVPGIEVGQHTARNGSGGMTGTTVIVARGGATAGVTQRGGAPGTRLTELLRSEKAVATAHAIALSGGSAYGLAAADGVVACLESQGIGMSIGNGVIAPVVPQAILFDPGRCAAFNFRPDASFGQAACQAANSGPVQMGNVGAGAGARSGGSKGGLGTASALLPNGVVVGAIVAVNSAGRVFDATTGDFFAGYTLSPADGAAAEARMLPAARTADGGTEHVEPQVLLQATTIAVVATNAKLTKGQANKVAQMADDGMARAIRLAHGTGDGDTVFTLATGTVAGEPNIDQIGSAAADVLSRAIIRALLNAESIHAGSCNVVSYCEHFPSRCALSKQ